MTDSLQPRDFIESGCVVRGVVALLLDSFLRAHREAWERHTAQAMTSGLRGDITSLQLALEAAANAHRSAVDVSAGASGRGNGGNVVAMSTTDAATELGITPRRVRQLVSSGEIDGWLQAGRWLLGAASVLAYKESRESR